MGSSATGTKAAVGDGAGVGGGSSGAGGSSSTEDSGDSSNVGAIVGGAVGGAAALALLAALLALVLGRRRRRRERQRQEAAAREAQMKLCVRPFIAEVQLWQGSRAAAVLLCPPVQMQAACHSHAAVYLRGSLTVLQEDEAELERGFGNGYPPSASQPRLSSPFAAAGALPRDYRSAEAAALPVGLPCCLRHACSCLLPELPAVYHTQLLLFSCSQTKRRHCDTLSFACCPPAAPPNPSRRPWPPPPAPASRTASPAASAAAASAGCCHPPAEACCPAPGAVRPAPQAWSCSRPAPAQAGPSLSQR